MRLAIILLALLIAQGAEAKGSKRSAQARCQFLSSIGAETCHTPRGYIVDHVIPLCKGGPDVPSNMQLQTLAEAKAKDRWECR